MKKGLIYSRVSTDEQAKEGQSIDAQIKMCRKYAQNNDIEVVQIFTDEGKSATNMNRPALQDMLGLIQDKHSEIDYLLVQDTDRLARNTLDHLKIKALLKKKEVKLIAINQPLIDDSPEGNLIDTMLAATNAFQSQITGRKVSKVMELKANDGYYPGGSPPIGYKNADNPHPTSNVDKRIIVLDESVAPYVSEAFKKYASGNETIATIAAWLNDLGIKSPQSSTKIHSSYVARMLRNPFYIGHFIWRKKLYTNGKHPKLISEDQFLYTCKTMDINNQYSTRTRKHKMLLRGVIFSKNSGKQVWGEKRIKNDKEYNLYFYIQDGKKVYAKAEELEEKVERIFKKIKISAEYRDEIMKVARELLSEFRANKDDEKLRLEKEKAKYLKAISQTEDDRYIHHTITAEEMMRLIDKYTPLVKSINDQLENLDIDHTERLEALERILRLAENIGESYRNASFELKKEYLNLFFDKIWIDGEKIVGYDLTPELKELIEAGSVRISTTGLPVVEEIRNCFTY